MKYHIIAANLFWLIALPFMWADNVTAHGSLGMLDAQLVTMTGEVVGEVDVWNTNKDLNVEVTPAEGYLLSKVYVYVHPDPPPPPVDEEVEMVEEPDFGEWPVVEFFKKEATADPYLATFNFEEDLAFEWGHWGPKWLDKRLLTISVRVELKSTDEVPVTLTPWGYNPNLKVDTQRCGWGDNALAMRYEVQHPHHAQFSLFQGSIIGLGTATRTQTGITGIEGGFWFFPGEFVIFTIGDVEIGFAQAAQRMTPLDIFLSSDPTDEDATNDPAVNMTRLLMTLDSDGEANGSIDLTGSIDTFEQAVAEFGMDPIDFTDSLGIEALIQRIVEIDPTLVNVDYETARAELAQALGNSLMQRNISKSALDYATDKPKIDIMPMYVPARQANGQSTIVDYKDADGNVIESHSFVKPLFVTYTEEQEPNTEKGITRRGRDIITAVSLDDGATWKRFNVSHMANHSSFTNPDTGEIFPGDCRRQQQKILGNYILVSWTSAYARGGRPGFAEKDADGNFLVDDHWGVRGRQGKVDYDEDNDVGDEGIGIIPYYALWTCRGVVDETTGDIKWFKPERMTSARRDAFYQVMDSANGAGFGIAWQEDPGGLRPGRCAGGGHGWSGATVHKKTDIWYSYISLKDFGKIDENWDPSEMGSDEHGEHEEEDHGNQPEVSNRPKWLVSMSHPVRVSDNNTVNTDNLKVLLDIDPETGEGTGLPVLDEFGNYIPLAGAEITDWETSEHEHEGSCDEGDDDHGGGSNGTGGGWGMARYAYLIPELDIASKTELSEENIWDGRINGEYIPSENDGIRWYRFVNKPGMVKTVAITADKRVLDGDTGACRPMLKLMPAGGGKAWTLLGYEETKGLGTPPEGDHEDEDEHLDRPEPDDWGKNVVYHSFPFDQPDMIAAGDVINLPALDDTGELIPLYYKDAEGNNTEFFKQYKTENARRVRFIAQPYSSLKKANADTIMVTLYKQGREGQGKPSDIFAVRCVVPPFVYAAYDADPTLNPFRFENFERFGGEPGQDDPFRFKHMRKHQNMSSAEVLEIDPLDIATDDEGHYWGKVQRWSQFGSMAEDPNNQMGYAPSTSHESFTNPYSEAKGHRGFLRGKTLVIGYEWTPNWGRRGGDHLDFYVRRSYDGGKTWTNKPANKGGTGTTHRIIERDPATGGYQERTQSYGPGEFEPARNVSLLKGNSHTLSDPRLVPTMGAWLANTTETHTTDINTDDTPSPDTFYVAFGTNKVLRAMGEPMGAEETEAEDIIYTRTTDGGETWLTEKWIVNPDSQQGDNPLAGEEVERFPFLAKGTPHQGHSQIRAHPSGTRLYAVWHQWADGDEAHVSPHDMGDDVWFRRIDFMSTED